MVCFTDYTLRVPKRNLDDYVTHILKKIYSFNDLDLWFLTPGSSPHKQYKNVELVNETDYYYDIKFTTSNFTTISNVLPETIKCPGKIFYSDSSVVDTAKKIINIETKISRTEVLITHNGDLPKVDLENMDMLIFQLANDGVIDKFYPLDIRGSYICISNRIPLRISNIEGLLYVHVENFLIFDFDDGFIGEDVENLNNLFRNWKSVDSRVYSTPFLPPNVVVLTS